MDKIRVLVVDDAVVVRRLVSDVLAADAEIEVVGTAANGRLALERIALSPPDLVTLDIEMPELDGLATLKELRQRWPRLPVIMFSTLTERGGSATLEALTLGANDYVTKPSNTGSFELAKERVREELVPRIKALYRVARRALPGADPHAMTAFHPRSALPLSARPAGGPHAAIEIVAIGCSTGGPAALEVLLPALPADFDVPIVIVQHMPPMFTRLLAERLDHKCAIDVAEAHAGMELAHASAYIAPGDEHLCVRRRAGRVLLETNRDPHENSCRPAVDVLFRSLVESHGAQTLAVVLTGMGQDGLRGCEKLRAAGATILVQDRASSVVWGMPGMVANAGLAERELPLAALAPEIVRRVRASREAQQPRTGA